MDELTIVGNVRLTIDGVPQIKDLQNFSGDNWGPQVISNLNFDRGTYCYLNTVSRDILKDMELEYDVTILNMQVRNDKNRDANLICHRQEDFHHIHGTINCLLVLKTTEDNSYINLFYFPTKVNNPKKEDKKDMISTTQKKC